MNFNFGQTPATQVQQPSLFGAQSTAPATAPIGFGFGTTPATAPSTGFGFGTTTTTASTGFGFGAKPAATTGFGFGTPAVTTATGFGFGTTAPPTTASTGFGTSLFGAPSTSTTGFGGFGTATTIAGTGMFGATAPGFGTTGTTSTGFGTAFGAAPAATAGFGAQAGINPQQQPQDISSVEVSNVHASVTRPQLHGDERDNIIVKWNQLQAAWGSGKGYFSQAGVANYTQDNRFCRFKAVGYTFKPCSKNEDGRVALILKKKHAEVTQSQAQIVDVLNRIFAMKPTIQVCVDRIKVISEERTEFVIYVQDRQPNGTVKVFSANEVFEQINKVNIKQQLAANLNFLENAFPKIELSKEDLKNYLDSPPDGIDPLIWQQAKLDNPCPDELIPVPMVGFKELQSRLKLQEQQTKLQQQRLDIISQTISDQKLKLNNMLAKIDDNKRKYAEFGHRLLKVIVKQEVQRKMGYGIQAEEEQLRVQLESLQAELNHPTQFKGRLNELMSQIRMQNSTGASRSDIAYDMDPAMQQDVRQLLRQQHEGLQHLIQTIKQGDEDMNLIVNQLSRPHR